MDQACVFENKHQYARSNGVLTDVISGLLEDGSISQKTKDAIETFQSKMSGKERYLAFWIRKSVCMTYDAMTTSPVESMNRNIKHKSKVSQLYMNYISCYFPLIISICTICTFTSIFFIHILYIQIVL
jgi:hypothetical protein